MPPPVEIYRAKLTLKEHTYFASREVGIYYQSEPLIGNYALAYALGLCAAPYSWGGPPRYKQDLEPLNAQGIYVTPGTFWPDRLRYALTQFNAQSDSYYFRFDQNAIGTDPTRKARATNFPQSGKIRMLGLDSQAYFFLICQFGQTPPLPDYIRLGKFNSKARVDWEKLEVQGNKPQPRTGQTLDFLLNAVDLPPALTNRLRGFSVYNVYPAPLLSRCQLDGDFWDCRSRENPQEAIWLPAGMRFGVEVIGE